MSKAGSAPISAHFIAGLIALVIVAAGVCSAPFVVRGLKPGELDSVLCHPSSTKDMGMMLQGMAFADPSILPVYGSSELTREEPNRADAFFVNSPTGFRICPVGGAGNTSLLMAQKLGAVGDELQGKKVAILLSCSWFRRPSVPPDHYAGNFSPAQAIKIIQDQRMDSDLHRRIATRILDFPNAMKDNTALHTYAHAMVTKHTIARWYGWTQLPLLNLQKTALTLEEKLGTLLDLWTNPPHAVAKIRVVDTQPFTWEKILQQAPLYASQPEPPGPRHLKGAGDAHFIDGFQNAKEWQDFEILLDVLKTYKAQPLIVAIPLDGDYEESHGVSERARSYYYNRVKELCDKRGFAMSYLQDHETDPGTVIKHTSHLSGKGWIFLNQLLDDFYHDRLPAPPAQVTHS